jgi:hypothetical protein
MKLGKRGQGSYVELSTRHTQLVVSLVPARGPWSQVACVSEMPVVSEKQFWKPTADPGEVYAHTPNCHEQVGASAVQAACVVAVHSE